VALAVAVFVPEYMELIDIECREAVAELDVPHRTEPLWWPGLRIARAVFAERGGDDHDTVAALAELCHQAGRRVGLVVRVRPDPEHGAPAHDTASASRPAATVLVGVMIIRFSVHAVLRRIDEHGGPYDGALPPLFLLWPMRGKVEGRPENEHRKS
jgi:hypothetical protein